MLARRYQHQLAKGLPTDVIHAIKVDNFKGSRTNVNMYSFFIHYYHFNIGANELVTYRTNLIMCTFFPSPNRWTQVLRMLQSDWLAGRQLGLIQSASL